MKATLFINEEVQGSRKDYETSEELKEAVLDVLDENVFEVLVKKRVAKDNSQSDFTKTCQNTCDRK